MAEFFYHRLWADPFVSVLGSGTKELWPGVIYSGLVAAGKPARVFIVPYQPLEKHLPRILDVMERARTQFPNFQFTVLAAHGEDEKLGRARGVDAFVCNHNCFLDERMFYPDPNVPKRYDAVYNARLVPSKRHELAAQTLRLAVISGGYEVERGYAAETLAAMRDLAYCNYNPASGALRYLSIEEVRRILVQSRCGLALSAEEGAMFASGEYLLAGLPVVTTRSRGGRDEFFHSDYVRTVEDDSQAVAAAVHDYKERSLDPFEIRNRTIALFREHRRRLVARLSEIARGDLFSLADGSMWLPQFKHQMRTRLTVNLGAAAD